MMTLTLDPKLVKVEDSVSYLRNCFSKFRVSLLRRFGRAISFIAIVELQKSGMAHLHVLIGVYIEQRWLSEAWQSVGGGRIVDIRYRDIHRIGAYLSKYLTKDLLLMVPANKKRISTSRDIRLLEKRDPSGWRWSNDLIGRHYLSALRCRSNIYDLCEDDGGMKSFVVDIAFSVYRISPVGPYMGLGMSS
jgi:hypothetical protein